MSKRKPPKCPICGKLMTYYYASNTWGCLTDDPQEDHRYIQDMEGKELYRKERMPK